MRAPLWWQEDGVAARLLAPLSGVTAWATARRMARPGGWAGVPVVCCGNATVGGTGKTPLALDLLARLTARVRHPAALTRGHGGTATGRVRAEHSAAEVGDEALLLAAIAPTFVGADRLASARAAVAAGADVLVMDDGLQNPGLVKDLSLLVVDAAAGFGNNRLLPAGPLREPVAAAAARCRACVLIGTGDVSVPLPVLRAQLVASPPPGRLFAFAGIGRPEKFFAALREAGGEVVGSRAFADHHRYTRRELLRLLDAAERSGAVAVTTAKDAVRLPPDLRERVKIVPARLIWDDPAAIDDLLTEWV